MIDYTASEVLEFIKENDVKFIRLAFCDIFGRQKNISIMPSELPRAFESGISFDASSIDGFTDEKESDLFLFPNPATLRTLPWRPSHGRVVRFFCDIKYPDGKPFEGDARAFLKQTLRMAAKEGIIPKVGAECEFYLFTIDDGGEPTKTPYDKAGYMDIAPLDKGENVRREICLTLEEMGIFPESSHHESGPGQNEIDFKFSDALSCADNLITFRSVVKTVAARNGLFASFMPKPLEKFSGSGLHINLSLVKNGINIFNTFGKESEKESDFFIAGILNRVSEMTIFLNSLSNSYKRFGEFEAPKYITWSHQNRSQLIRIPAATGENMRMELRSPDPCCNPYLAFSLLILAGLEGIKNKLPLQKATDINLFKANEEELKGLKSLPLTFEEAIFGAKSSDFLKENMPPEIYSRYLEEKEKEADFICKAGNDAQIEETLYFKTV